jgi:hypothetical protein
VARSSSQQRVGVSSSRSAALIPGTTKSRWSRHSTSPSAVRRFSASRSRSGRHRSAPSVRGSEAALLGRAGHSVSPSGSGRARWSRGWVRLSKRLRCGAPWTRTPTRSQPFCHATSGTRHRPTGRLADWPAGRLADWPTGRLADWPTGRLADWPTMAPADTPRPCQIAGKVYRTGADRCWDVPKRVADMEEAGLSL